VEARRRKLLKERRKDKKKMLTKDCRENAQLQKVGEKKKKKKG